MSIFVFVRVLDALIAEHRCCYNNTGILCAMRQARSVAEAVNTPINRKFFSTAVSLAPPPPFSEIVILRSIRSIGSFVGLLVYWLID